MSGTESQHFALNVCPNMNACFYMTTTTTTTTTTPILWAGCSGIDSRGERGFPHPSRPTLGPPSLLYNGYRVFSPEVKRPGHDVNHPPRAARRLKKK